MDTSTASCVSSCPSELPLTDEASKKCVANCEDGTIKVEASNKASVACPVGTPMDLESGECVDSCPADKLLTDVEYNVCVASCDTDKFLNLPDNSCYNQCPDGTFGDQANKVCSVTCPVGTIAVPETNTCFDFELTNSTFNVVDTHLQHSNRTVRIHLGDFNGDKKTDILRTWDSTDKHRLFLSNGSDFSDEGQVSVPDDHLEHSNNTVRVHLGDFNGDGKTDILRTWDSTDKHRLFLSNGTGFDQGVQITVPDDHLQHSNNTVRIHLGDFNGDGKTDLLRTWDDTQKHRLFYSTGGGFTDGGQISVVDGHLQHSNNTVRIHVGDFNGDGKSDILRTWDSTDKHRLFLSKDNGFDEGTPITVADDHLQHSNNTVRVHLGDFNGDGKTDILRTWDSTDKHRLFLSNGTGFDEGVQITVPDEHLQHSNNTVRIHLGDFNGDGKTDILRTWDNTDKHRLFLSFGNKFSNGVQITVPDEHLQHSNNTVRIHLGDFNGDGKTDILRTWDSQPPRLFYLDIKN